jgi:hypothetical protein
MDSKPQLFDTGHVVRTARAWKAMKAHGVSEWSLLERHQRGDFGLVGEPQRRSNQCTLAGVGSRHRRILSAYRIAAGIVWILTEFEQRTTTVLTPEEYAARQRAARAESAAA